MGTVNSRTACHYCKVRSGICHPRVPRPHVMLSSCHARTRRGSTGIRPQPPPAPLYSVVEDEFSAGPSVALRSLKRMAAVGGPLSVAADTD